MVEGFSPLPAALLEAAREYALHPGAVPFAALERLARALTIPADVVANSPLVQLLRGGTTEAALRELLARLLINDGALAAALGHRRRTDGSMVAGTFAGVFGWDGDRHAAVAYPGGYLSIDEHGEHRLTTFDVFRGVGAFEWFNAEGYLPCLVTRFEKDGVPVEISSFADRVEIEGRPFAVAYSRVSTGAPAAALDPGASPWLIPLLPPEPSSEATHDFAQVIDSFGREEPFPQAATVRAAGGWSAHFDHMRRYWDARLTEIAQVHTPDPRLNDAYRAGFIYTHIVKDGHRTHVGANGYARVWDHDALGILSSLFTAGCLKEGPQLLAALPPSLDYPDAIWKFAWPWALYLQKTGDRTFVRAHWSTLRERARQIAADRTGPGGIMKRTNAIDAQGYWLVDNWSALLGLEAFRVIALALGEDGEAAWARAEYLSLLAAVNASLVTVMDAHALPYLPASLTEPNDANRCHRWDDANWAAHFLFGRWAWDGWLLGAPQEGPGLERIDDSYDHGLAQLRKLGLPRYTFGGYPEPQRPSGFCSAYNAGYGAAALRGQRHRTLGIRAYQFMIEQAQSGPYCWWENIYAPVQPMPWRGVHPMGGNGSCPHMWGQSTATKVLLDSLVAEFHDGRLLVGRGIPDEWLRPGQEVEVRHFPIRGGRRVDVCIRAASDRELVLTLEGACPEGEILFGLPAFLGNVAATSAGTPNPEQGWVALPPSTRRARVRLERAPTTTSGG